MTGAISTITIRDFIETVKYFHPKQTILLRGRHGIGKSEVVYRCAENWGLPIVERRVAQLCEADMIGLPDRGAFRKGNEGEEHRVTAFLPKDGFLQAMLEPCVVFLDEINRGTPEVQQACFQFVEKGELNGRKIHPDSRIIAAVNFSREYNVTPMGLAFLDRFAIFDLDPDKKDFLDWAQQERRCRKDDPDFERLKKACSSNVHPMVTDFIRQCNTDHFEIPPEKAISMDQHEITPSRRSWARLSNHLVAPPSNMPALIKHPDNASFYHLCRSFVGPDASRALQKFIKEQGKNVTPDNLLNDFQQVKGRVVSMSPEEQVALIDKLYDHLAAQQGAITMDQGKNLSDFMKSLPDEIGITLWNKLASTQLENASVLHKYVAKHFLRMLARTKIGEQLPHLADFIKDNP